MRTAIRPSDIDKNWHFDIGTECSECGEIGVWVDEDGEHEYCDKCGSHN